MRNTPLNSSLIPIHLPRSDSGISSFLYAARIPRLGWKVPRSNHARMRRRGSGAKSSSRVEPWKRGLRIMIVFILPILSARAPRGMAERMPTNADADAIAPV